MPIHDDTPPIMPDPPEDADDGLPRIPVGGLFAEENESRRQAERVSVATFLPPPGASPLVALILAGVSDPQTRRAIEEAVWYLNDGRNDHLLTQAAALFAAIGQAQEQRQLAILDTLRRLVAHQASSTGQVQQMAQHPAILAPEQLKEFGRALGEAIVQGQTEEFASVHAATKAAVANAARVAVNGRTVAVVAAAFFAGMAVCAILFFVFHR